MTAIPVLETDAEIIAAIREKKAFNSSVLTGTPGDLAYSLTHDGETIAFWCIHGDLYVLMDPSVKHLSTNLRNHGMVASDNFKRADDSIHSALFPLLSKETVALCSAAQFSIACTVHEIATDAFIDQNIKDRGQSTLFLKMAFALLARQGESD